MIMKRIATLLVSFYGSAALAQQEVASLTESLVHNCKNDQEKTTAIFRWITDNISYTTLPASERSRDAAATPAPDDDGPLKPLNERVAEAVLRRRTAFCDGYARLFTAMCNYAGIESEVICGYANGGAGKASPRFGVNHYWNAVKLEGKWHLVDATWASGYIDTRTNAFIHSYDDRYYLASPDLFIRDHYPDDPRWTLLPDNKVPDEFRYSPFRQRSFSKYAFTAFSPGRGIIEASVGDTIVLQLESSHAYGSLLPAASVDSSLFSYSSSWVFLKPDNEAARVSRQRYTYPVTRPEVQWLYLLYNDDVVMRYKLNVRQKPYN